MKKEYFKPLMKDHKLQTTRILAGSDLNTNSTTKIGKGGSLSKGNFLDFDDVDETEE